MALTFSQITAIATNLIDKKLTDNVYGSNPVIKRLSDKSKKVDGGAKIQVPVISSSSTSGGAYDDLDALTLTRTDNITAAVYDWRQYYEAIRISQLDMMKTSGDAGKLDLVKAKLQVAESALADRLGTGIFSAGTSAKIDGFEAMISATATYGGIIVADMASWAAVSKANAGTVRPLTLGLIQSLIGACTYGKDMPSLLTALQAVYDEAYNLFQPHQRIESDEIGKLGFKSLVVNGIPLVVDSHMKAASIFAINEEFAQLVIHKNGDMRKVHHDSLEGTDSSLHKIFWAGNLTCSARRMHGELGDIKTA